MVRSNEPLPIAEGDEACAAPGCGEGCEHSVGCFDANFQRRMREELAPIPEEERRLSLITWLAAASGLIVAGVIGSFLLRWLLAV